MDGNMKATKARYYIEVGKPDKARGFVWNPYYTMDYFDTVEAAESYARSFNASILPFTPTHYQILRQGFFPTPGTRGKDGRWVGQGIVKTYVPWAKR